MEPVNRRILSVPRPVSQEPSRTPCPLTNPIQLNPTSTAMAALVLLFALFFLFFFSTCTRRLLSLVQRRNRNLQLSSPRPHPRGFIPFPPPYGLDQETLRSLPVVKGRKEFGCCVVCLSDFVEKDQVKVIPKCGHGFHPSCIDGWLVMCGSCPVCRCSDMVTGSWSYSGFDSASGNDGGETSSESSVEEVGGREKKAVVRLARSNSWGLQREVRRVGSGRSLRRTCSC